MHRRVCVFAGSRAGDDPRFAEVATAFGRGLARRGLGLVYGGGSTGMMGAAADGALAAGGEVIGVIPDAMVEREWAHRGVSELCVVADMHARKARMNALSDAFVALPGGIGTLEELFEVYTWAQLDFHRKPVVLLDVAGFYAPLLAMLEAMVSHGFLAQSARELLWVEEAVEPVLDRLQAWERDHAP